MKYRIIIIHEEIIEANSDSEADAEAYWKRIESGATSHHVEREDKTRVKDYDLKVHDIENTSTL